MTDAPSSVLNAITAAVYARGGKPHGDEIQFLSPCHDDHHPSASWNIVKCTWFCPVCGIGGGWKDLAERLGISVPQKTTNGGGSTTSSSRNRTAQLHTSV